MKITIEFSAHLKSLVGTSREELELPAGSSIADALQLIVRNHPEQLRAALFNGGALRPHVLLCVDEEQVAHTFRLNNGDKLLVLSPISGG
jgi:molybdopterin converting factor small subunit